MMRENFLNVDRNSKMLCKHFRNNLTVHSFKITQIMIEIRDPNLDFMELFFDIHNSTHSFMKALLWQIMFFKLSSTRGTNGWQGLSPSEEVLELLILSISLLEFSKPKIGTSQLNKMREDRWRSTLRRFYKIWCCKLKTISNQNPSRSNLSMVFVSCATNLQTSTAKTQVFLSVAPIVRRHILITSATIRS